MFLRYFIILVTQVINFLMVSEEVIQVRHVLTKITKENHKLLGVIMLPNN